VIWSFRGIGNSSFFFDVLLALLVLQGSAFVPRPLLGLFPRPPDSFCFLLDRILRLMFPFYRIMFFLPPFLPERPYLPDVNMHYFILSATQLLHCLFFFGVNFAPPLLGKFFFRQGIDLGLSFLGLDCTVFFTDRLYTPSLFITFLSCISNVGPSFL